MTLPSYYLGEIESRRKRDAARASGLSESVQGVLGGLDIFAKLSEKLKADRAAKEAAGDDAAMNAARLRLLNAQADRAAKEAAGDDAAMNAARLRLLNAQADRAAKEAAGDEAKEKKAESVADIGALKDLLALEARHPGIVPDEVWNRLGMARPKPQPKPQPRAPAKGAAPRNHEKKPASSTADDPVAQRKDVETVKAAQLHATNILDNIDALKGLISEHGTAPLFGPQGEIIRGRLIDTATSLAKLGDPDSAALGAEVALQLKRVLPEGTLGRLVIRDSTAIAVLDELKKTVEKRMRNLREIRSAGAPPAPGDEAIPNPFENDEE
jgi:hypothetical protein